jgi:hypothetical protein
MMQKGLSKMQKEKTIELIAKIIGKIIDYSKDNDLLRGIDFGIFSNDIGEAIVDGKIHCREFGLYTPLIEETLLDDPAINERLEKCYNGLDNTLKKATALAQESLMEQKKKGKEILATKFRERYIATLSQEDVLEVFNEVKK